jgi:hypothetical protein
MRTGIIQHRSQEIGATRFILWPTLQRLLPAGSDFRYSLGWPEFLIATTQPNRVDLLQREQIPTISPATGSWAGVSGQVYGAPLLRQTNVSTTNGWNGHRQHWQGWSTY